MQINNTSNSPKLSIKKQPTFTSASAMESLGTKISTSTGLLKGFAKNMEAKNFSLSPLSLVALLYGATIVPRYIQAYDKHDRREILLRDTISISALLYLSSSLNKGFSKLMSGISGFALSLKPKDETGKAKNLGNAISKAWGYFNPLKGLEVLNSEKIVAKYSNVDKYKNGIVDFIDFIQDEGGDIKQVLSKDPTIKAHADKIVGADIKSVDAGKIREAFDAAKKVGHSGHESLDGIYQVLKNTDNKLVSHAKTMNSAFGFLSTVLLVPAFMIWIQRFNEKLTKKIVAKELAQKEAQKIAKEDSKNSTQKSAFKGNAAERITMDNVINSISPSKA